ncbi:MAG: lysine--tRNA ligase [Actinomycetota bacterium]
MAEEDLYQARLDKVEAIRAAGDDPWPTRFDRTHVAAQLHDELADLAAGSDSGRTVSVAGRLTSSRSQGKIAFGDLVDTSGKIQLFVPEDVVQSFESFDVGDIVGAQGEVVRTKRGELSVRTSSVVLLAKALIAPPSKWHGLIDTEIRYRQRYLDLLATPEARRIAELRSEAVRSMRRFFDARDFHEVETPILHAVPGGATARPFVTHHNALDADLYLRVAPELYLKRLVVGGMERVYEIGRVFRNEGIGYRWNPEFTMLEAYQAYTDYRDMEVLITELFAATAQETLGSASFEFEGHRIDFGADWRRATFVDLVAEATGEKISFDVPIDDLRNLAARHDVEVQPWWGHGLVIAELYERLVEPNIVEPTIVADHPLEISPLARTHPDDPNLVERFEPIVVGRELGNAFSELNDPVEQRRRFEAQVRAREHGDLEANPVDEAYVRALEYGLPPTGGLGVGVDRLVMLLTGVHSIREVILFPALRPRGDEEEGEEG